MRLFKVAILVITVESIQGSLTDHVAPFGKRVLYACACDLARPTPAEYAVQYAAPRANFP